jgi:hypothetical protein
MTVHMAVATHPNVQLALDAVAEANLQEPRNSRQEPAQWHCNMNGPHAQLMSFPCRTLLLAGHHGPLRRHYTKVIGGHRPL